MSPNEKTWGLPGSRSKAEKQEMKAQIAAEQERRSRLGVPAVAGGVLYLLSGIIISSTLNGAPTVGVLQGIAPALRGVASPQESARAAEVRFVSHHAFALIAGSALSALSLLALTAVLLVLLKASRLRRPEGIWQAAVPVVIVGGVGFALVGLGHQIATAILSHSFTTGTDFSNKAVDRVLATGGVNVAAQYISLMTGLALTAGMIYTCTTSMRLGLLTRWMGFLGILAALLIFLPIGGATLEVIPAFWMAALGILFMGRWPNGDLPAWTSGEARQWPTAAEMRAQREAETGGGKPQAGKQKQAKGSQGGGARNGGAAKPAEQTTPEAGSDPAPVAPAGNGRQAGRKRRKRGPRG